MGPSDAQLSSAETFWDNDPALIDWPLGGGRQTEDKVCYALSNGAPASVAPFLELNHPRELASSAPATH